VHECVYPRESVRAIARIDDGVKTIWEVFHSPLYAHAVLRKAGVVCDGDWSTIVEDDGSLRGTILRYKHIVDGDACGIESCLESSEGSSQCISYL
jgi:hypothetical protein